jgi:2'-hydroxyisoflavone reductase
VDTSGYTARQVRASCTLLQVAIQRYVYISAVMAYGDPTLRPVRETHALLPAVPEDVEVVDGETYGPLKATCEGIVQELFGDQGTRLRPQIVVGPMDPTPRYTYWLQRCRRGGRMLAPGDGTDHVQVVDVRDLARFTRTVIEQALGGAFNVAGPRLTWMEFLTMLGAQQPVWVPGDLLDAADLRFGELPLYRREHGPRASLMDICTDKARAAGQVFTTPAQTAADTWAWCSRMPPSPDTLSPQREAELIDQACG